MITNTMMSEGLPAPMPAHAPALSPSRAIATGRCPVSCAATRRGQRLFYPFLVLSNYFSSQYFFRGMPTCHKQATKAKFVWTNSREYIAETIEEPYTIVVLLIRPM